MRRLSQVQKFLFSLTMAAVASAFLGSPSLHQQSPNSLNNPEGYPLHFPWESTKSNVILLRMTNDDSKSTVPWETADILICGGGPTGLLAAIMMAQKFPESHIQIHDRFPMPPSPTDESVWGDTSKYYLIGLGGRGITSLEKFGLWNTRIAPFCLPVPGRKDWTPEQPEGLETIRTDRKYITQVLPRDKLVSLLHQHIVEEYTDQIEMVYQSMVRPVDFEYHDATNNNCGCKILVETASDTDETPMAQWTPLLANWVIASDGSARTFANRMEDLDRDAGVNNDRPFQVVRYDDDNERVYKTLPFRLPELGWTITTNTSSYQCNSTIYWNYAVRSPESRVIFDALPANAEGDYVGILLMRGDDPMAQPDSDSTVFRDFLRSVIPQFIELLPDDVIEATAKQTASDLPKFRYVTPRMHQGAKTVLLGDTAHTVKPFFGMGANTALEDVKILGECIDVSPQNLTQAIWNFSAIRTPDVELLVQISRDLDRPGPLGALYFLIPVILDGIFQKLAPQVFKPNIISLIQNEEYTFRQAFQRKQKDRFGQLLIVGTILYSMGIVSTKAIGYAHQTLITGTGTM